MLRLNKYLSGSTLVEVLVSMTILVMIMVFSFAMIVQVKHSHLIELRTKAFFAIDQAMIATGRYVPETGRIDYGSFYLESYVEDYGVTGAIKKVIILAKTPDGQTINESMKLVSQIKKR